MKKLVAFVCAAVLAFGTVAAAAPSITGVVEEVVTVTGGTGTVEEDENIVISDAEPEHYSHPRIKEAVLALNEPEEGKEPATVEELTEILKLKEKDLVTNKENKVNPEEYSAVTKFMDLGIENADKFKFKMKKNGTIIAEITTDVLKDIDPEDLEDYLIMFIDPKNSKVSFIELEKEKLDPETGEMKEIFDPETGKIEVEFPGLGAFTILQKNVTEE